MDDQTSTLQDSEPPRSRGRVAACSGVLTAARAVELLSSGPAAAFGLPGGHLAPGAPADLTVINPSAEWTVDPHRFQSKSRNTPFAGMRMVGQVVHTFVGGRPVWFEGALGKESS